MLDELAARYGAAPALMSPASSYSFSDLQRRASAYTHWARSIRLAKGDVVAMLMSNEPDYVAAWLGISRIGVVVALLNTNLTGPALAHTIAVAAPVHVIVDSGHVSALRDALKTVHPRPVVWVRESDSGDADVESMNAWLGGDSATIEGAETPVATIDDTALLIYTSGTTGLPKAARISHARLMQWSHWFAGLMDVTPADRMYNCLPMYHSVGGVLAVGAVMVAGGSVVVRDGFSASEFWRDIVDFDCTLFQYVGELCRYLVNARPDLLSDRHRIRLACGNGLRRDVWLRFAERFRIPRILEFYAATEGNVSLFNVDGKPGAVGRIPGFLRHRFRAALIKLDVDAGAPLRDARGFCVRCSAGEIGELVAPLAADGSNIGDRFEGYTSSEATARKVLRDVFDASDAWVRTGDLMRTDEDGYFYFVDRIGDTFRWKGENVSTTEVSAALSEFPGIDLAVVYGVAVPGTDGKAGMATIAAAEGIDLDRLRRHLSERLPPYARPLFLRLTATVRLTGTFKFSKTDLAREGFDPSATRDAIYLNAPHLDRIVPLDAAVYRQVCTGDLRL